MNDKHEEKLRYDKAARNWFENNPSHDFGHASEIIYLNTPYIVFDNHIKRVAGPNKKILELGSGSGKYTFPLLQTGANVIATDISHESLMVLKKRMEASYYFDKLKVQVADMEDIPFEDNQFDIVTIAGSLSYGDSKIVDKEIFRVLKEDGYFICVDSMNFNPIFRLNRYINYLRGFRSMMTLKNMPTVKRVRSLSKLYKKSSIQYFGCISYLSPIISLISNGSIAKEISDTFDRHFGNPYLAFKFVIFARK